MFEKYIATSRIDTIFCEIVSLVKIVKKVLK